MVLPQSDQLPTSQATAVVTTRIDHGPVRVSKAAAQGLEAVAARAQTASTPPSVSGQTEWD